MVVGTHMWSMESIIRTDEDATEQANGVLVAVIIIRLATGETAWLTATSWLRRWTAPTGTGEI